MAGPGRVAIFEEGPTVIRARLYNFTTGSASLLPEHEQFLTSARVLNALRQGGSVHIEGLASRLGSAQANQQLAQQRVDSLVHYLREHAGSNFQLKLQVALGEDAAAIAGMADGDNTEYWRSIIISVWTRPVPPPVTLAPIPPVAITRAIASVSWIDRAANLRESDDRPTSVVQRDFVVGSRGYRFSHLLEARITVTSGGRILNHSFSSASTIYRGPSALGVPSEYYETQRQVSVQPDRVIFRQVVGARTRSPEVAGGSFGPLGNIIGGLVMQFPPIWSMLELTIHANGQSQGRVLRHSLFPSLTFYQADVVNQDQIISTFRQADVSSGQPFYNGVPSLNAWKDRGWGTWQTGTTGPTAGNPWGIEDSIFTGIQVAPFGWQ